MLEILLEVLGVWLFLAVPIAFIVGIISYRDNNQPGKTYPPYKPPRPLPKILQRFLKWANRE